MGISFNRHPFPFWKLTTHSSTGTFRQILPRALPALESAADKLLAVFGEQSATVSTGPAPRTACLALKDVLVQLSQRFEQLRELPRWQREDKTAVVAHKGAIRKCLKSIKRSVESIR